MSVGQEGYHQVFYELLLAYYDLAHFEREDINEFAFFLYAVVEFLDVYTFHIVWFISAMVKRAG